MNATSNVRRLSARAFAPLACWLCAAATAQGPLLFGAPKAGAAPEADPKSRVVEPEFRPWPADLAAPSGFDKSVVAHLNGFHVPDVACLGGRQAFLLTAVGITRSVGPLPAGAVETNALTTAASTLPSPSGQSVLQQVFDIAALRGMGRRGQIDADLDALALATAEGTFVWRRVGASGDATLERIGDAAWQGVRLLAAHRLDASSVYGITANGALLRADATPEGYAPSGITFPSMPQAHAITCVDWDASPGIEVAVLRPGSLTVLRRDGTIAFQTTAGSQPGQRLATLHGPIESLAWLTPGPSCSLRVGRQNTLHAIPLPLEFVGLSTHSMDLDPWDDIVLSTRDHEEVTVLQQRVGGGMAPFAYNDTDAFRIAMAEDRAARRPNQGNAVAADLDADGDMDLLALVDGEGIDPPTITMQRNCLFAHEPSLAITHVECTAPQNPSGDLDCTIEFVAAPLGAEAQVLVFEEQLREGEWHCGRRPVLSTFVSERVSPVRQRCVVTLRDGHLQSGGHYHVLVRPTVRHEGRVSQTGPATLGILFRHVSRERALANAGGGPNNPPIGDIRVGGIVGSGPLPPTPADEPPSADSDAGER